MKQVPDHDDEPRPPARGGLHCARRAALQMRRLPLVVPVWRVRISPADGGDNGQASPQDPSKIFRSPPSSAQVAWREGGGEFLRRDARHHRDRPCRPGGSHHHGRLPASTAFSTSSSALAGDAPRPHRRSGPPPRGTPVVECQRRVVSFLSSNGSTATMNESAMSAPWSEIDLCHAPVSPPYSMLSSVSVHCRHGHLGDGDPQQSIPSARRTRRGAAAAQRAGGWRQQPAGERSTCRRHALVGPHHQQGQRHGDVTSQHLALGLAAAAGQRRPPIPGQGDAGGEQLSSGGGRPLQSGSRPRL